MLASMEHRATPPAGDGAWDLLAELNPRVGNELQVALSALRLAKRKLASSGGGAVHRRSGDPAGVLRGRASASRSAAGSGSAGAALGGVVPGDLVFQGGAGCDGIRLTLTLDDVAADEETAWTVCVVAFELMTNAFKHAFPGGLFPAPSASRCGKTARGCF